MHSEAKPQCTKEDIFNRAGKCSHPTQNSIEIQRSRLPYYLLHHWYFHIEKALTDLGASVSTSWILRLIYYLESLHVDKFLKFNMNFIYIEFLNSLIHYDLRIYWMLNLPCNMSIEWFAQSLIFNLLYTLFQYFIILSSD